MEMPKTYVGVVQWTVWKKRFRPDERLGQAFCNMFDIDSADLFYTTDEYEALSLIEKIISDKVGIEDYYSV